MNALAGYASLVLVFGDAVRQATPAQGQAIRARIMPLVEDLKEPGMTKLRERQLLDRITLGLLSIMGDSWQLSEESRKWIGALLYNHVGPAPRRRT